MLMKKRSDKPSKMKINTEMRVEKDSMGEVSVPKDALYGAQTARAIENFPLSALRFPRRFIHALGLIKGASAKTNLDLKLLDLKKAKAIMDAAESVAEGQYDKEFPLDVFQTGSGTSSNMNANEVIANLASIRSGLKIHPNDDVNMSQSSNDVIPTAIHLSTSIALHEQLLPALRHLQNVLTKRSKELSKKIKTGRTHLMDALPITFGQELSGYAEQVNQAIARIEFSLPHVQALAIGGTAVGTGLNAHKDFGKRMVVLFTQETGIQFKLKTNYFEALSSQDSIVELSGNLRCIVVAFTKIANDLRWMNSGPEGGLGEIVLPAVQPGSSIMPNKVNPVIPEAVLGACAQVLGCDTTIAYCGASGNFQLNTYLPVIAYNILHSIQLLSNSARLLADKAIADFTINEAKVKHVLDHNPILVTALNPIIGYEKGAVIAKKATKEKRPIIEVAKEMTNISEKELQRILDPYDLTQGGIRGKK